MFPLKLNQTNAFLLARSVFQFRNSKKIDDFLGKKNYFCITPPLLHFQILGLLELYKISFFEKLWKIFLYNSNRLERCVFVSYLIKETYFFLGQNFFFYSFSFEICLRQNNSIRVIQKNLVKKNHNALNFV